jgi:hypothetical protein
MADKSIRQIPSSKLIQAEIAALARVHLWVIGEIHLRIADFSRQARAILLRHGGAEGVLDGASGYSAQTEILKAWGDCQVDILQFTMAGMRQAARLPFSLMAEEHNRLVRPTVIELSEASRPNPLFSAWIDQQFRNLVASAQERTLDGLNLSGRVWRMDREVREAINMKIVSAIVEKQDAFSLAKQLEQYLGASEDCPRWTSSRLYGLTKSQIAGGDLQGLIKGDACDGQGVAYKALRLARTEIQAIHGAATDVQLAASPWVQMERIVLSESHPEPDICDDVISQGDEGKGIYPVGTIVLPLHPECLCYKVSVNMSDDDFVNAMRGWLDGSQSWPAMDAYGQNITGGAGVDLTQETELLNTWLYGSEKELEKAMKK